MAAVFAGFAGWHGCGAAETASSATNETMMQDRSIVDDAAGPRQAASYWTLVIWHDVAIDGRARGMDAAQQCAGAVPLRLRCHCHDVEPGTAGEPHAAPDRAGGECR